MGPSDSCRARLPRKRCHVGSPDRPPVLQVFACAYVLRPLPRRAGRPSHVGASGRPPRPSSFCGGLGARIGLFGACSGFTHVAARTLADPSCRRASVPGASMVRSPFHLPSSYQGVPTPPWAGFSPAASTYFSRHTTERAHSRLENPHSTRGSHNRPRPGLFLRRAKNNQRQDDRRRDLRGFR